MKMKWCVVIATASLTLTFSGLGCGSEPDQEFVDEGEICFGDSYYGQDRSQVLPEDEQFEIWVLMASCLSTCEHNTEPAECSVELECDTLTVTSYGAYSETSAPLGTGCAAVCVEYGPTCEAPPLDEGTYRLEHGDDTYEVAVPGEEEAPNCLGEDDQL